MAGISDLTMATTQYALDGLAERANARANDIANDNTPGFQARGVSFESALAGSPPTPSSPSGWASPPTT
jgi:flagellar basal-body rod protein FlgB